jgi:hypothetical protein
MYNQQIVHVKYEPMTEQMVNMVGNPETPISVQELFENTKEKGQKNMCQ